MSKFTPDSKMTFEDLTINDVVYSINTDSLNMKSISIKGIKNHTCDGYGMRVIEFYSGPPISLRMEDVDINTKKESDKNIIQKDDLFISINPEDILVMFDKIFNERLQNKLKEKLEFMESIQKFK